MDSPVLSTPVSGISLRSKWKLHSLAITPDDVRKKLFDMEDENEPIHWSSSSGYFSQSLNDASGVSETSQTDMFDEYSPSEQQKSQVFLTAVDGSHKAVTSWLARLNLSYRFTHEGKRA